MADLPPAEGIRSKGFTLKGALAFVEEGYGQAEIERVVEALPAGSRELVRGTLLDGGWYPFRTQVDLYEAIDRVLGSGDLALCWEIGKFTSERELTTLHRLFLKVSSLELWLRSAGVMWRRYYSGGALEVESMEDERGAVRVVEFNPISKAFCFDFGGWLHRTLELNKRQEVRVAHPECLLDGAPACRYEATWRTGA